MELLHFENLGDTSVVCRLAKYLRGYMCNEPGREGGLIPTKTDDVYLLYLSHKPQTQSTNI